MLGQRGIRVAQDLGCQGGSVRCSDVPGPPGTGAWCHGAAFALPPSPPLDSGRADAEEAGGLGLAEAGVDGAQQPLAEVDRILLHSRHHR